MPQDINGSCIVDVVCCGMRRGWRVQGGSSGSGQLTHEVAKRQGTIGLASAQRGSGLFWRINQFPRRSISAAGERAKTRPTKAGNCRGTCSAPRRPRPAATVTSKTRALNGCVRDGSFSTTAKPIQGRTLMTWMSSGRLDHILFAKEACDFPFPLLSHSHSQPASASQLFSIYFPSPFRGGHECIAWPT